MRSKQRISCVAAALVVAPALVTPALVTSASARPASPVLRVTGTAGSSYWVTVGAGTELANAASYSTSPGAWSGIALVKPSHGADAQVFVALDLPQSVRCGGNTCPWTVPPPDLTSDPDGRLAAGRYRLVLLGDRGKSVSVALQPLAGRVRLAGRAPAVPLTAALHHGTAAAGNEVRLHTFDWMPGGHGFAVAWSMQFHSAQPAGLLQTAACVSDGPVDTTVASVGGVAPCADFSGFDFVGNADAGPISPDGLPGYAPVDAAAVGVYGPQDTTPIGAGWDSGVVAPAAHLGDVFVGFAVPF